MPQVIGSFISGVRDACQNGLLDWSPRLMLAMYECDIQASSEYTGRHCENAADPSFAADVLGKVYGVVARRRGRIVAEEMKEGTTFFTVRALLPVVESFGFSDGRCSGTHSLLVTESYCYRYQEAHIRRCQSAADFQRVMSPEVCG